MTAAVSTPKVQISLIEKLNTAPLSAAKDVVEVCSIINGLVEAMTKRNHGLYFVELGELDAIVKSNPVIQPNIYPTPNQCDPRIEAALKRLQEAHCKYRTEIDIVPSLIGTWEYATKTG